MDEYLVMADADRVQEYVFQPHELRLIRGGSSLQVEMNRERLPELARSLGGRQISANGGTVLVALPSREAAKRFCRNARRIFWDETRIATISTAMATYPFNTFRHALDEVRGHLEASKLERGGARFHGGGPMWAACSACGAYPASEFSLARRLDGQSLEPNGIICEACREREKKSNRSAFLALGLKPAKDLEWIGGDARPVNYIAFLYLDLDRMGEWLPNQAGNAEERYASLSEQIHRAVSGATMKACAAMVKQRMATHEIFLIGGDDVALAVPAHRCFEFLRTFQEQYESAQPAGKPTFSVGMTIANSHFPISEFRRVSQELVRSAKALKGKNSIDYQIITDSMVERVEDARKGVATLDGRYRTAKPYSLDDFFGLESSVKKLKTIAPASKVKALYSIAHRELPQAELDYLTLLSRIDKDSRVGLLESVGQSLFGPPDKSGRESTRAADLAELWEFADDGFETSH